MPKFVPSVFDYESMSKAELLEHVTAYSEALHQLAGRCMTAENRLRLLDKHHGFFEAVLVSGKKGKP